jgi:hypothetical protein
MGGPGASVPLRWLALGVASSALAVAGWVGTDRLEQRNDFCNACHLQDGTALHLETRRDFDQRPAVSLAAAHAEASVEGRPDPAFRCIDCHGGVGPVGRTRVKILSARDAFWYAVGRFEEPDGMRFPLWDEDCSQCHASFRERAPDAWRDPGFHELAVHNVNLGMACVACHRSHEPAGLAEVSFLEPTHVRARCAECHPEFEEGGT